MDYTARRVRYELLTRKGCHLCESALAELRSRGVEPELIDIDLDPALLRIYDFRVPVLMAEGRVAGEGIFEPGWLSPASGSSSATS